MDGLDNSEEYPGHVGESVYTEEEQEDLDSYLSIG